MREQLTQQLTGIRVWSEQLVYAEERMWVPVAVGEREREKERGRERGWRRTRGQF